MLNNYLPKIKELSALLEQDISKNIFRILKIEDSELKHSDFLKWLFNGTEDKEFHLDFTQSILSKLDLKGFNIFNIKELDDYEVRREFSNIDLFFDFKKFSCVIVIENKFNALESENQLSKYSDFINYDNKKIDDENNVQPYKNYRHKVLCFLTKYGADPIKQENKERYQNLRYEDVYTSLKETFIKHKNKLSNEVKLLIKNYLENLEVNVMGKNQDSIKEVLSFYNSNKEVKNVVDNIMKYNPDYEKRAKLIKETLQKNDLSYNSESAIAFIDIIDEDLKNFFKAHNLDEYFIYAQVSNNSSSKPSISWVLNNKNKEYMKDFFENFTTHFENFKAFKGEETFRVLKSYSLMNIKEWELEEIQKQSIIIELFNKHLNNEYRVIKNYIKEYFK